ncbi:MAG: multicopper oxidase domain-containing protein [Caldilineaceae bacterium]
MPAAAAPSRFEAQAQVAQSITFGALPGLTFGDADFTVSATASSGLPVSFVAGGNCTVAGTTVHLTGAGSCTITASQAGNASYLPAPDVQQSFAIAQAVSTTVVTFEAGPYDYRGTPFTATALTTGAGGLNQASAVAYSGDCTNVTITDGCTATANFPGDINYTASVDARSITITPATPTLAFGTAPSPEFPGGNFTVNATTNADSTLTYSVVSGPCAVIDSNAGSFSPTAVGTCVVQVDSAATANFVAASIQLSLAITPPSMDLYAVTGNVALPGATVPIFGFTPDGTLAVQPGGPVLDVAEGATVAIVLHNQLNVNTALLFQGQEMIPDTTGVAPGATKVYSFVASRPGTYLYEAGLLANAQYQAAMGLYGVLIVRPATPGRAYDDATTAFNDEAVLLLSDIDPALNMRANPATFDMRNYAPKYFLINGKVYPNTDPIATVAGNTVLLRYVNAGLQAYSMGLLGMRQRAIAMDGSLFTYGRTVVAETIAPGQTADMLATVPAAAVDGSKFALFDGNLMLHNNKTNNTLTGGFGGMLTFVTVAGTPPTGDTTGPVTTNVSLTPNALSATVSDATSGGSAVTAAEFFIDATGANGTGTPMTGAFGAVTVNVSGLIAPALSGSHTVYVHGVDSAGNWGAFQSAVVTNDTTGPTTTALSVSPNPSNGSVDVTVNATADDSASGGSNIAAAEYTIDGGAASPMAISPTGAKVAGLATTIVASTVNGLSDGTHVVAVRSQDTMGNWGATATVDLVVDKSGPTTSNVSAAPNPNNGTLGINSSTPAVRVAATFDGLGNGSAGCIGAAAAPTTGQVAGNNLVFIPLVNGKGNGTVRVAATAACPAAEGFIDVTGANGTGFILLPTDGLYDTPTEAGYVDIPLTTIAALSDGDHLIHVHAKDTAGNWGGTSSTVLVIDKTAPTIVSVTLTPATIAVGAASVTLTLADGGTGASAGQYWIDGTATPPANPTGFAGTTVTINTNTLAGGTHTIYVRAQDGVGNWSTVASATLSVIQAVNDARSITANTSGTQTSDVNAAGLLANDQPIGAVGRVSALASAPVRTAGNGAEHSRSVAQVLWALQRPRRSVVTPSAPMGHIG